MVIELSDLKVKDFIKGPNNDSVAGLGFELVALQYLTMSYTC